MECLKNNMSRRKNLLTVKFLYKSIEVHTSANEYVIVVYFVYKNVFLKPWNYIRRNM